MLEAHARLFVDLEALAHLKTGLTLEFGLGTSPTRHRKTGVAEN